jgi:hypothetical protein
MVQENLVHSLLLCDLGEAVVVLAIVASSDGVELSGSRFCNSGREGHLWVCVHLSLIRHKEVGYVGGVELWAPYACAYPQLWQGGE